MPEPTIITGSIMSDDYVAMDPEHSAPPQETNIIALSAPKPGTIRKRNRTFRSLLPSLRISVKETHDRVALDGTVIPGDHEIVKFRDGVYRTKNKKEIDAIENSTEWGITVYDEDIWREQTKKAQAESIAAQMKENPELMAQVMNSLKLKTGAETFEAPPEEKPEEESEEESEEEPEEE